MSYQSALSPSFYMSILSSDVTISEYKHHYVNSLETISNKSTILERRLLNEEQAGVYKYEFSVAKLTDQSASD